MYIFVKNQKKAPNINKMSTQIFFLLVEGKKDYKINKGTVNNIFEKLPHTYILLSNINSKNILHYITSFIKK